MAFAMPEWLPSLDGVNRRGVGGGKFNVPGDWKVSLRAARRGTFGERPQRLTPLSSAFPSERLKSRPEVLSGGLATASSHFRNSREFSGSSEFSEYSEYSE